MSRFETGKWYHLAATFKRPVLTTYVNGRKVGSARWDYPVGYQGDLEIGRWGGQSCHKGLIDEVKIFNRALSAEEVQASYAAEAPQRTAPNQAAYQIIPTASQPVATIENRLAKLEIDARGRCTALIEKRTGRNLLAKPAPLAAIKVKGNHPAPDGVLVCRRQDPSALRQGRGEGRHRMHQQRPVFCVHGALGGGRRHRVALAAVADGTAGEALQFHLGRRGER